MSQLGSLINQMAAAGKIAVENANRATSHLSLPFNASKKQHSDDPSQNEQPNSAKVNNAFTKILTAVQYLPKSTQSYILTKTFGKIVPYVGTTGITYEKVTANELIVSLENKKAVRNHIGSIHAVAITLLAETATGFILGINLPSDRILLIKSYEVNFYRPIQKGEMAAIATLNDEQRQYILDSPKGEMVIPCIIEDRNSDSDRAPIVVEMTWAWIPKSELEQRRSGKGNA